jgi:hypothetical protein
MKKTTTKKAPAKRASTRKPAARRAPAAQIAAAKPPRDTRRGRLQRLLFEAITQMDEDGLVFLLRQAHVLRSNANAERIDREIAAYEQDRKVPTAAEESGATASIELSPDGKSYFLSLGTVRKALTRGELGAVVRVCLGAVDRDVGMRNLFRALGRDRGDILVDAKIAGPKNPFLGALYDTVLDMKKSS